MVACLKCVELRSTVDPLTGVVLPDDLSLGASPADQSALEWALRCTHAWGGRLVAVSAGPPGCDAVLREALAAGASEVVRVALDPDTPSEGVAGAVASAIASFGDTSRLGPAVFCGDASVDRGSGAVPAFLAGELAASQALGLVGLEVGASPDEGLTVSRRLDRGRREILQVVPPFVVSLEGGTARLRRATLGRELSLPSGPCATFVPPRRESRGGVELVGLAAFRPRARAVPPPTGESARERVLSLTGAGHEYQAARTLVLEPEQAAGELLSTLADWGELPEDLADKVRRS